MNEDVQAAEPVNMTSSYYVHTNPTNEAPGPVVGEGVWFTYGDAASNLDRNKMRGVNIEQLNYGYIVTVGCHKFAIEKWQKVVETLALYMSDPAEAEKQWFANEFKLKKNKTKK